VPSCLVDSWSEALRRTPAGATAARRQRMAIMEAAISSSISHPNVVQTYTYQLQPGTRCARGCGRWRLQLAGPSRDRRPHARMQADIGGLPQVHY
jgi:hypothetical protein